MPQVPKATKTNTDRTASRVSRSGGVTPLSPPRRIGMPPPNPFRTGMTGGRSSSFDVTASQAMQQTNDEQDVAYFQSIHDDPPYAATRWYVMDSIIREYIREALIEESYSGPEKEDEPEEDVDEFSGAGAIAGYVGPLGSATHMTPAFRQASKQNKVPGTKRRKRRKKK